MPISEHFSAVTQNILEIDKELLILKHLTDIKKDQM
jgi:hypothetical protein